MDISYEKILYRIIKGRLRIKLGDLVLCVRDPTDDILEESYEIYDEAYQKAYFNNVLVQQELRDILYDHGLWNPADNKKIKEIDKKINDLRVEAFKSVIDRNKLQFIKAQLRFQEREKQEIISRNESLNHASCEGAASFARNVWIIQECTFKKDGTKYNWESCSVSEIMGIVNNKRISSAEFRTIARNDPWRSMWSISKNSGNLFGKSCINLSANQSQLCIYSMMYDNVYESPERPNDKVIEDDDCLDGWFEFQKRKYEKEKKQQEVDALTSNPKIANSQEVFVMASDQQSANDIYDLNDPIAMSTIKQRKATIAEADGAQLDFRNLHDIKQDIAIQSRQEGLQKMRGK